VSIATREAVAGTRRRKADTFVGRAISPSREDTDGTCRASPRSLLRPDRSEKGPRVRRAAIAVSLSPCYAAAASGSATGCGGISSSVPSRSQT
jgi:hypothetical protein